MPCWTVQETQIDFGQKTDTALLTRALAGLGLNPRQIPTGIQFFNGSFNTATGKLTLSGSEPEARTIQLRKAYGAEIAKREAARHGWTLQADAQNPYKFTILKR